jgi:anti-sigma factor RsiW
MNMEIHLQLQAYLDGELPESEARAVESRLQQDAGARSLLAELRQTRSLLVGQEVTLPVPESREFYWSKIRREIEREMATAGRPTVQERAWAPWLRMAFSPSAGLAAAVVLSLCAAFWFFGPAPAVALHETEVSLPNAQMLTFRDQQERMTVVWLTYNE